jgi:hypothetical protein
LKQDSTVKFTARVFKRCEIEISRQQDQRGNTPPSRPQKRKCLFKDDSSKNLAMGKLF